MRRKTWTVIVLSSLGVPTIASGCASADSGTTADALTTFAAEFLRQLLAAFLL